MSIGRRPGGGLSLEEPETEALAILSSHWRAQVLDGLTVQLDRLLTLAELLDHGARLLGQSTTGVGGDDRTWRYPFPLRVPSGSVNVFAPVEAILLRAEPQARTVIAQVWAGHQGPHDGRAHDALLRIAEHPDDVARRRHYARFTVTAPWRLVRDDPGFFVQFADRRPFGAESSLPCIDDLRAMLSEPQEDLVGESLGDIFIARSREGGLWVERADLLALVKQASEVPGNLVAASIGAKRVEDHHAAEIEAALARLAHADEHPIARLAGDLCFLRVAALERPVVKTGRGEVDLRQELPDLALRLLDSVMQVRPPESLEEAPPITLASLEGAVLRVCRDVVAKIGRRSGRLPPRDWLWLTYRLYQWLIAQMERVAPDERYDGLRRIAATAPAPSREAIELLDPAHFDPSLFDHRLATVLYTLGMLDDLLLPPQEGEAPAAPPPKVTSRALEDRLVRLAERERRGMKLGSALDWNASGEIAELAMYALLRRNMGAFARLAPEARRAWLSSLPAVFPSPGDRPPPFTTLLARTLVIAASDVVGDLGDEERKAFEEALRRMDDSKDAQWCRALGFTGLFGPDAPHLEVETRDLLFAHVDDQVAPILFGRFLMAIATMNPGRLEEEATRLRVSLEARGASERLGLVIIGLTRVILHGPSSTRPIARDVLARLADKPPFVNDAGITELLRYLEMPRETP
jgi:hypothetical protein